MTSPQGWDQAHTGAGGMGPGQPQGPPRNGFGIAALTLGLIGGVLFWTILGGLLLGLLAVIFGILGFRRGKRGQATNGTLAIVGAVIGGLALIASAVVAAVGLSLVNSGEFDNLEDCVRNAQTQAEERKCQDDFADSWLG
ncbi:MAG: DUF4190 domain-containing protein [Streptomyces sp.]|uniref:DUF4190 domain-containing protein n=1 Tax=Streptomyces sp. TaxID=1931 RepID=UPI003D6C4291